jgi:predicted nucleotidyltransferase
MVATGEVRMSVDVVDAPRRRVTLDEVRAHRDEIYEIGRRYGVSNIRVFGSVARGEADEHSDLDLLIDVAPEHGLFSMAGFAIDVEELMGVFTQVATVAGLKSRIRDRVVAQAVPV